jgi:hypothetical protein
MWANAIYMLESEDLTHLGGPMGSEYTTTNFRKYFSSVKKAKEYAEQDYKRNVNVTERHSEIEWKKWNSKTGYTNSGDLSFVMYTIARIEVE